jgi:hypothetical protein
MQSMRPVQELEESGQTGTPFRAAFGRARQEALGATTPAPGQPRFEYRLLKRAGKRSAEEARWNALGADGWELVGITPRHAAFKRAV